MTSVVLAGNYVRANWGRWLADCPACAGAMQVWTGQFYAECGDCGVPICELIWPADPEGIEALLSVRPLEKTRNWHPGETLNDLLAENILHDIFPRQLDRDGPSVVLLEAAGERITGGLVGLQLTSDMRRHQIEGRLYGLDNAFDGG